MAWVIAIHTTYAYKTKDRTSQCNNGLYIIPLFHSRILLGNGFNNFVYSIHCFCSLVVQLFYIFLERSGLWKNYINICGFINAFYMHKIIVKQPQLSPSTENDTFSIVYIYLEVIWPFLSRCRYKQIVLCKLESKNEYPCIKMLEHYFIKVILEIRAWPITTVCSEVNAQFTTSCH